MKIEVTLSFHFILVKMAMFINVNRKLKLRCRHKGALIHCRGVANFSSHSESQQGKLGKAKINTP